MPFDSLLQEWNACLGHASIASAVAVAETSFVAWKALAVDALARERKAAQFIRSGTRRARRDSERARSRCDEAARELAECCEASTFGIGDGQLGGGYVLRGRDCFCVQRTAFLCLLPRLISCADRCWLSNSDVMFCCSYFSLFSRRILSSSRQTRLI